MAPLDRVQKSARQERGYPAVAARLHRVGFDI
jgi:hypothetical protein